MTQPTEVFGFLSICSTGDAKLGGYLLVDPLGRPLEFHCTEPVKPNRAQQILFGASLDDFICGERIAHALISNGSKPPSCVITDCASVLSVRSQVEMPVALLQVPGTEAPPEFFELDNGTHRYLLESNRDVEGLLQVMGKMNARLDPAEPFERIHGAVEELRKAA